MAKVSFNKLGLKKIEEIATTEYNEQIIEIKQYLPVQQKLELLSKVITQAADSSKFYNPGQLQVFFVLELIQAYTNISFTEKQKEDFCKTFDLLAENGIISAIIHYIPEYEIETLRGWLKESIKAIYEYNNSARAILESLQTNYDNLNFDLDTIQDKVRDPETLSLLKEIAPLLNLA